MAYPTRGRDPLLDAGTQAFLEKRGRELTGGLFIAVGLFLTLMIATYSSEDATWLVSGETGVNNWTGRFGASVAAPLLKILGFGSWAIAIVFLVWGMRLLLLRGLDRMFNRTMYAPVFVAVSAIYAATLTPSEVWLHSFSLGGLFGDSALHMLLLVLPGSAGFGANLCSVLFGIGSLVLGLFVCGVTIAELQAAFRKSIHWGSLAVAGGVALWTSIRGFDRSSFGQSREPESPFDQQSFGRQKTIENQRVASIIRANPPVENAPVQSVVETPIAAPIAQPVEVAPQKPSVAQTMLAKMPSLLKRDPEPQTVQNEIPMGHAEVQAVAPLNDDRIRQKITHAINAKMSQAPSTEPSLRSEPMLSAKPVGPDPMILQTASTAMQPNIQTPVETGSPFASMPERAVPEIAIAEEAPMVQIEEDDNIFDDAFEAVPTEEPQSLTPVATQIAQVAEAMPQQPMTQQPVAPVSVAEANTIAPEEEVSSTPIHQPLIRPRSQKPVPKSKQAVSEAEPKMKFEAPEPTAYETPPLSLLMNPDRVERHVLSNEALEENARMLETVLDDYGVKGDIVSVRPGPVVTMYELEPAPGLKASRVIGLADDIARSMSALATRVSTVPGRSVIGIELPNENREIVALREILSARDFGDGNHKLPLALGKDIGGQPIVANLAKMPHLLIAGTTGSGKSVAINTMILSLLYKLTPDECRMIMIDPKMLELSVYDGIPHLLSPVVTDPKKAVVALKWVVGEMEDRYRKMSKMGVRNIDGYNSRVKDALEKGELFSRTVQTGFDDETGEPIFETEEFAPEKLPYIVVIVDEMADLMMVAGKEIEACIQRLAQMARASGIHLIMATQRPSVDVITGTIKANFPTRISFQVTSKVDSRTILGEMGAEQLLGMGDMLYMAGGGKITRVHGPFCSDEEVEEVVNHQKAFGPPKYLSGVVDGPDEDKESSIDAVLGLGGNTDGEDALYDTAVQIVIKDRKCSTSYIQRKLAIGYNKAARLVEQMEDSGLVSAANHVGKREILVPEQG